VPSYPLGNPKRRGLVPRKVARTEGLGGEFPASPDRTFEAVFEVPYLAHATMEPMNCTADVRADSVTVWAPTQFQAGPRLLGGGTRGVAAKVGGVSPSRVTVHTTHLGGGFGRRSEMDFVSEACEVSKAIGAPVKVIWTREDDIRHDQYRPAVRHQLRAALDDDGSLVGWTHHIISPSIMAKFLPGWLPGFVAHLGGPLKGGIDGNAIEGAVEIPYAIPNLEVRFTQADLGIPVKVRWSYGATEAKVPEIVDAIVDITETGSTLRAHGMKIIETLLESQPVLVANRAAAADPSKRAAMDDVTTLLLGALRAESRVLIKLNVTETELAKVLEVVPSMKAPTVSPLSEGGYAIETVVEKRLVNTLIPQLKAAGATDILELPISKIVP